ncbi:chorion protein S38-like [Contarinia nasturtii]|uniref:chorion protein S38-like n=1 Tax=Contarinia nasturtii TaxID=265458 RepID=UPI0012D3C053|nr:chorion protein S38-like [Contarinia nasturtii]
MATTRAVTLLLLSFAFNKAYCTPVPQCGQSQLPTGSQSSPPSFQSGSPANGSPANGLSAGQQPEVYKQNNGQPLVLVAKDQAQGSQPPPPPPPSSSSSPSFASSPSFGSSPSAGSPSNAAGSPSASQDEINIGHQLADQSISDGALETIPAPNKPCKEETSTEVVQHPGETFVHQPGEILINQPPTRLIINHAPYIVRPSPIVVNSGARTVTNAYTRRILPSTIQLRPVIVRLVKPIERKVLLDKPAPQPGSETYASNPEIPGPCSNTNSAANSMANSFAPANSSPFGSSSVPAYSQPASAPSYSSPAQTPVYGDSGLAPAYGNYPSGSQPSYGYPSSYGSPSVSNSFGSSYPGNFGSSAPGAWPQSGSGMPDLSSYLGNSPLSSESDAEISTGCGSAVASLAAPSYGSSPYGSSPYGSSPCGSSGASSSADYLQSEPASAADINSLSSLSANSLAGQNSFGSGSGCV